MEALYLISLLILFCCSEFTKDVSAVQDVEMNSTLSELGVAYNNQEIFFTCLVRGSNVLDWNSAEYIGQGGFPLQLLSFASTETNVSSRTRPSTYAVRRSVTTENGRLVIVSDLRIIASTQYPVATVTCGAQSSKNITFHTLMSSALPPPATHDMTFNITTIQYTPATTMMAATATTGDFAKVDGTRENQQSYTARIACLTVLLIISLMVNIIVIILIITIIKVRCKGSPDRDFEEEKQKRKFLDVLQSGRELFVDCMNPNKVPTESEDLVPALKSLSDALSTGIPSAFKEAIKDLTDNLRVNKVSNEVLEESLKKLRETIQG